MEQVRITPEQEQADKNFLNNLQAHLNDWKTELEWTERELMEQALIDAKANNGKSSRYQVLEKNERQLKENIAQVEQKLGKVGHRVNAPSNPAFAGLGSNAINHIKR